MTTLEHHHRTTAKRVADADMAAGPLGSDSAHNSNSAGGDSVGDATSATAAGAVTGTTAASSSSSSSSSLAAAGSGGPGEFSGLVSYFSSQQDDLE